ncbi:MAG: hypothetical protein DRQ88_10130 [Epsilonproteobacteria bacterium]|nr:MAG: hypothetical protein DRQ89_08310 [Campylobacterota bacterium]RLA64885.1 MAG: hypothetical protein DRQ88_10130 [Campylobacterota bacterium]
MKFVIIFFLLTGASFAKERLGEGKKNTDAEIFTDFKAIKEVLENDQLSNNAQKIEKGRVTQRDKKLDKEIKTYSIPGDDQFWNFISELWVVKNVSKLKWNFEKPDYGLDEYFANFMQDLGYYEVKFKILLLDTSLVTHFSLPSNNREAFFLLSVPFIRVMDLTKLEISILLLEDYMRGKLDQFKNKVVHKDLKSLLGKNFYKKKLDMKIFNGVLDKYNKVVFESGFNFEEQFAVTKQMQGMLHGKLKHFQAYMKLLGKMSSLVKRNLLYKDYNKIYPSPDLQLSWLKPAKKVP